MLKRIKTSPPLLSNERFSDARLAYAKADKKRALHYSITKGSVMHDVGSSEQKTGYWKRISQNFVLFRCLSSINCNFLESVKTWVEKKRTVLKNV